MPSDYSRRSLLGAGAGALGALAAGGYAWGQYAGRHRVQFRPLELVNESAEEVLVVVVVGTDIASARETVYRLAPADGDGRDRIHHAGNWIKSAREWAIRAEFDDQRLELDAPEIHDRLEGSGWGADCAHVAIVVREDGRLATEISPSDGC